MRATDLSKKKQEGKDSDSHLADSAHNFYDVSTGSHHRAVAIQMFAMKGSYKSHRLLSYLDTYLASILLSYLNINLAINGEDV